MDRLSHDALLAEVARLAAALEDVRQHVEDLSECQGDGQQLDRIRQTVREKTQTSLIITVTVKTRRGFASSAGPSQLQVTLSGAEQMLHNRDNNNLSASAVKTFPSCPLSDFSARVRSGP